MTTAQGSTLSGSRIALFAALACAVSAIAIKIRAHEAERANPPRGKFVEVDGVCLHYRERGEGPPVVLLHGNGTMLQDYDISGLPALASQRYRTIEFDRPGFGHSDRPRGKRWGPRAQAALFRKAFERLGIVRPVVVGHSWGTQVALALALDHPAQVRSVVLLSGYYFPTFRLDVFFLSAPALPVIGDFMRYTISPWLGRLMWSSFVKKAFAPSAVPPRFAAFPMWMSLRPSQLRAAAAESALMIPDAFAFQSRYSELKMPVFIMAGAGDRIVDTRRQSMRLHRALPHSQLFVIPDAGHMIHHVVPQQVLGVIDAADRAAAVDNVTSIMPQLPETGRSMPAHNAAS
ncbi:MAG: alpha/beta hydrolase [Betaproteobacteria bacterium]|nr:alpha/beta hydrolase [Betaproteobacteria bacterium]